MAEITDAELAELRRLHEAATPPERFSVTRYGHGGGRVCAEPRDLVADFYSEADRECWIAARNALPALLSRIERAEKDAKEARQVSERDRCPSNESLRGTMDILEDARVNGGDMPISAGKAIELCETVIALRARISTLEAALRATFGAYNRCAACGLTPEGISGKAHSEDCLVGAALRGLEGK